MLGADEGFLKLMFDPATLKLISVHIMASADSDRSHRSGRTGDGWTIEYFRDTVFNYPTLAEAYKVAALDGLNKL